MTTDTKRCSKCGEVKPRAGFYRRSGTQAHLMQSRCIACTRADQAARRADPVKRDRDRQQTSVRRKAERIVARHHALEVELHMANIAQQGQEA